MKALIISGGGSKGSFAGGVICSTVITTGLHHIVATFVPSTSMKIYLDGVDITDASTVNSSAFLEHFSSSLTRSVDVSKKSSLKNLIIF